MNKISELCVRTIDGSVYVTSQEFTQDLKQRPTGAGTPMCTGARDLELAHARRARTILILFASSFLDATSCKIGVYTLAHLLCGGTFLKALHGCRPLEA